MPLYGDCAGLFIYTSVLVNRTDHSNGSLLSRFVNSAVKCWDVALMG